MDNNKLLQSAEVLKKGGTIMFQSSIGQIIAANAFHDKAIKKIKEIKNQLKTEAIVITDNESKLIMLLEDIPDLAYDLIENTNKPLILKFDKPSGFDPDFLNEDNTLSVYISKDEIVRKITNRGIKALAAIPLTLVQKNQEFLVPGIAESILQSVDYVVDLQQEKAPSFSSPSVIRLKTNGEIKILQK